MQCTDKTPGKNKRCPSFIKFSLKRSEEHSHEQSYTKHNLKITLEYCHNHIIFSTNAQKHLNVGVEAEQIYKDLYLTWVWFICHDKISFHRARILWTCSLVSSIWWLHRLEEIGGVHWEVENRGGASSNCWMPTESCCNIAPENKETK